MNFYDFLGECLRFWGNVPRVILSFLILSCINIGICDIRPVLIFFLYFSEDRIRNGAKKLLKARHSSTQGRLDSFFKVLPSKTPPTKRKVRICVLACDHSLERKNDSVQERL